jgi:hypothetical protein
VFEAWRSRASVGWAFGRASRLLAVEFEDVERDFENPMAGEADPANGEIHLYADFCVSLRAS